MNWRNSTTGPAPPSDCAADPAATGYQFPAYLDFRDKRNRRYAAAPISDAPTKPSSPISVALILPPPPQPKWAEATAGSIRQIATAAKDAFFKLHLHDALFDFAPTLPNPVEIRSPLSRVPYGKQRTYEAE